MFFVSGIATQGLGLVDEWTTSYRVLYSNKSDEDFREYSESGTFPKVKKKIELFQFLVSKQTFFCIFCFLSYIYHIIKIPILFMYAQYFLGNDDQNGTVLHWLRAPFFGRYIRLSPFKWHGKGCLRAEIYGCPSE